MGFREEELLVESMVGKELEAVRVDIEEEEELCIGAIEDGDKVALPQMRLRWMV